MTLYKKHMIKQIALGFFIAISSFSNAQVTSMINKENTDSSTKVYGFSSLNDKTKAYEKYNFLLENTTAVEFSKPLLEYGYQSSNMQAQENGVMIYMVKDKKIVDQWFINPAFYNVFHDGIAYSYDADKLGVIAEKYPLLYKEDKRTFVSEKEYKKQRDNFFKDPYNLIITEPDFTYQGYFDIQFPKNEQFKTVEDVQNYLKPIVEKLTKNKFDISYAITEKNILDRNQFTLSVAGDENIYKKIKLQPELTKGGWIPTVYEATIYRKMN